MNLKKLFRILYYYNNACDAVGDENEKKGIQLYDEYGSLIYRTFVVNKISYNELITKLNEEYITVLVDALEMAELNNSPFIDIEFNGFQRRFEIYII